MTDYIDLLYCRRIRSVRKPSFRRLGVVDYIDFLRVFPMDLEIPPLETKSLLEPDPLRFRILNL